MLHNNCMVFFLRSFCISDNIPMLTLKISALFDDSANGTDPIISPIFFPKTDRNCCNCMAITFLRMLQIRFLLNRGKRREKKKTHVASPKVQAKQCSDRQLQILGGQIEILNSSVLLTDSQKVVTSIARRVHVKCKQKKNYLQTYICTCISVAKRLNHSRVIKI